MFYLEWYNETGGRERGMDYEKYMAAHAAAQRTADALQRHVRIYRRGNMLVPRADYLIAIVDWTGNARREV